MNLLETYQRAVFPRPKLVVIGPPEGQSDARGGFATPAAPGLYPPGATDPRIRAFTKTILDPSFASDPKFQALPDQQKQDLAFQIPPPEDLDRVALFAPPAPGFNAFTWPGGVCTDEGCKEATWADIAALGPDAVKSSLAWWRQAVALGPLPEDDEYDETDPREPSYAWPNAGSTRARKIYFWGFGKDGRLYQHMQLQKKDTFDNWRIFNRWGQNLTFVFQPSSGQWIAGWDFGDWFTQNKVAIAAGIQIAFQAIVTVLSVGTAAPGTILATTAEVGAIFAANQALGAMFTAAATGNWDQAFQYMIKMGTDLASIPEVKSALANNQDLQTFVKSEPIQVIGKITSGMKWPPSLEDMVKRAGVLAKDIPISPDLLKNARAQVPPELQTWFDVAYQKGKAATLAGVPWYAQGVFQYGATLGAFVDAKTYFASVAESGAGQKMLTVAQTLAMLKQSAAQARGALSWRQALNAAAGIKAPRKLPPEGSRSPPPASEKTGLALPALVILVLVAAFFFFR